MQLKGGTKKKKNAESLLWFDRQAYKSKCEVTRNNDANKDQFGDASWLIRSAVNHLVVRLKADVQMKWFSKKAQKAIT